MTRRGRSAAGHGGGGHDGAGSMRWLLTYADLITLLMVFFVVLYSMARVDAERYSQVASSLRRSFGGGTSAMGPSGVERPGGGTIGLQPPVPALQIPAEDTTIDDWLAESSAGGDPEAAPEQASLPEPDDVAPLEPVEELPPVEPVAEARVAGESDQDHMTAEADARLAQAASALRKLPGPPGALSVELTGQGLVLDLLASLLFNPGQAKLRPGAADILSPLAVTLRDLPYSIMVHGTGEDAGGGTANWNLAALRSVAVIEHLVDVGGVPADRLVAVGYGGRNSGGRVSVVVSKPIAG